MASQIINLLPQEISESKAQQTNLAFLIVIAKYLGVPTETISKLLTDMDIKHRVINKEIHCFECPCGSWRVEEPRYLQDKSNCCCPECGKAYHTFKAVYKNTIAPK